MNFLSRVARAFRWLPEPTVRRCAYLIAGLFVLGWSKTLFEIGDETGRVPEEIGRALGSLTLGFFIGVLVAAAFSFVARGLGRLRFKKRRIPALWAGSIIYALSCTLAIPWTMLILLEIGYLGFAGRLGDKISEMAGGLGFGLIVWMIGGGLFFMLAGNGDLAAGAQPDVTVFD